MLWSPNEVLAYLKEESGSNSTDKRKLFSKTSAFGGFPPKFYDKQDFILIAENSEIYGPNPLFTIPCQAKETDLNVLATRILSADYQGLSCKKMVSLEHAQLLMPDVSENINIAVNYFLLFDSDARGFIRPTCVAYITADKYKLVSCADSILQALSEASTIFQHSNMLQTIDGLKSMLQDVSSQFSEKNSNQTQLQNKITEDVSKDIQDIIQVIEAYEGNKVIDKQISTILENLKNPELFSEVNKFFTSSHISDIQPFNWKNKSHHCLQKKMKSLYSICGNGLILGLYHLYILHKHFRRKYENIYSEKYFGFEKTNDEKLHFGACVKVSDLDACSFTLKDCILRAKRNSKMPSMDSDDYFYSLNDTFNKVLLDFFNWEQNLFPSIEENHSFLQSSNCSDISVEKSFNSSSSGYISSENVDGIDCNSNVCGHVVPLESIWDILEDLERDNSGIESAFLEIIKLFDDTKKILFAIFTRIPLIIISTPEDCTTAQNFITALSVFIPRRIDEVLLVELNRQEPLKAEELQYIAALNVCIPQSQAVEEIIPQHLWPSLCILNLRDCSLTAPEYVGVLLSNIDERFRMLPLDGPAFPIIIGILCEVQQALEWWLMVTLPSIDASAATSSILSKGFSKMDVQILLKLLKLCRR